MTSPIIFTAPDYKKHAAGIDEVTRLCFNAAFNEFFARTFRRNHYSWNMSQVGLLDGRVVGHIAVWDYIMRIGRARVRVGGIGGVGTHPDMRGRGIASGAMRAAIKAMREGGCDMTRLSGIHNFYDRFGYTRAWAEVNWIVKAKNLPEGTADLKLHRTGCTVNQAFTDLYNRFYKNTTGTALRPTYSEANFVVRSYSRYAWHKRNKPVGYVIAKKDEKEPDRLVCCEHVGTVEDTAGALFELAKRLKCETIVLSSLPWNTELARVLRQGNCSTETHYIKSGGSMVGITNLATCLEKMKTELSARLKKSHLNNWRGSLLVSNGREKAALKINRGIVMPLKPDKNIKLRLNAGDYLARLIIGTNDPMEIAEAGGMRMNAETRELVKVLFPVQHPTLSFADRF